MLWYADGVIYSAQFLLPIGKSPRLATRTEDKRPNGTKITSLPPLCKGRWFGVSRAGGIVRQGSKQAPIWGKSASNIPKGNPSVSLRLTAPFTQGSQVDFLYHTMSFPHRQFLRIGDPSGSQWRASSPKRGAEGCQAAHFTRGTARKSSPVTRTVTPPALTSNIRALKSSADSSGTYARIVTAAP